VFTNRWLQRSNGTWKALDSQTTKPPSLRQMSNIDSLIQQKTEENLLRSKLPKDSVVYEEGMFYQTIKEGSGRLVKVTDTLSVHYTGSLFSDGSVFDETTNKPATFPLERLIKGWQLGLVHCKVGGKMRLYLPSGSAYGIRTRSAEIPPNSILVFDVEVLDAKEKIAK
jgi:FKBP-type peptidyl-prolyl cis-trans isomerase